MVRYNPLIPELAVKDIERSKQFYINLLGFTLEYERKENHFAFISYEGSQFMLEETISNTLGQPLGKGVNFSITGSTIDRLYKTIQEAKYPIKETLAMHHFRVNHTTISHREFAIQDPDGYYLRFTE